MQQTINLPIPSELVKYQGTEYGTPATTQVGQTIPIDIQMHVTQRDISTRDIIKWCHKHQGVDWNLFGYATAVKLPDGTLKLINGQHRIQLVKWLLPEVTEVPAHIIQTSDDAYIGSMFADMNGGCQRRLTPEDLLWAEIIGGDPKALNIQHWLQCAGLACGKVNAVNDNPQVSRATFEACLGYSESATVYAVDLFNSTWKKRKKIDSQVVTGLTLLFSMPDYQVYSDTSTRAGQEFRTWFQTLPMAGITLDDIKFTEYKNMAASSRWELGFVYGIVQKFNRSMVAQGKGHICEPSGPAKKMWQGKYPLPDANSYELEE